MKKLYYMALAAVVGIALSSCSLMNGDKSPKFSLSNLQGYWQNNQEQKWHIHFTTEATQDPDYPFYGYEWGSFGDDVTEQDVLNDKYGNGWFKYDFETTTGGLHEIHLMTTGGGEIPKYYYTVSILTETELEYYEKDRPNSKVKFTKVVSAK